MFAFNGVDNSFKVSSSSDFNIQTNASFSVWIKPEKLPNKYSYIVNKWVGAAEDKGIYLLSSGKVSFILWTCTLSSSFELGNFLSKSTIPVNIWTHISATYNGNKAKIYINGVLDSELVTSLGCDVSDSSGAYYIADNPRRRYEGGTPFQGKIDEPRIYNRALSNIDVMALYKGTAAPNLDMTNATCRYVAPIYVNVWRTMKVTQAPTCAAVLQYHTWLKFTFWENAIATNYYMDRINDVDTESQIFNARLQLADEGIGHIRTILDPDLQSAVKNGVLSANGYKLSTDIMKSKGIIKSLASGQTVFKLNTVAGRVLNSVLIDKVAGISGNNICQLFLNDATALASCSNEATKLTACGLGLATTGWQGVAGCVQGSLSSLSNVVMNSIYFYDVIRSSRNLRGYLLINAYLENRYSRGLSTGLPDDAQLEADIKALAKITPTINSAWDYNMAFVKAGIRSSIDRNLKTGLNNLRLFNRVHDILQPTTP